MKWKFERGSLARVARQTLAAMDHKPAASAQPAPDVAAVVRQTEDTRRAVADLAKRVRARRFRAAQIEHAGRAGVRIMRWV